MHACMCTRQATQEDGKLHMNEGLAHGQEDQSQAKGGPSRKMRLISLSLLLLKWAAYISLACDKSGQLSSLSYPFHMWPKHSQKGPKPSPPIFNA